MAFWSALLSQLSEGNIGFTVTIGDGDVAHIYVKGKKVIVEIKSPVLALEFGVKEFLKRGLEEEGRNIDMSAFENIKKAGYKVVIKYGPLEFEI